MSVWADSPPILAVGASAAALATFLLYMVGVVIVAAVANRLLQKKSFLSEYFLGSRGLGVWAFALTFAATSASGGSFTGFPSKIYTHGWVLALWIGSYMVVPICTMGLLGKRINQVARISGSITVPDVLRDRFHSPAFGLLAVSLIVFFMSFNLVAQFKAGSMILQTLLNDIEAFRVSALWLQQHTASIELFEGIDAKYLLCLFTFGLAVVLYTTYGGFHAVVWTDVMQGVVMVVGVLIMLPLALIQVGKLAPEGRSGLEHATRQMARMTPPRIGTVTLSLPAPQSQDVRVTTQHWLVMRSDPLPGQEQGKPSRLFRLDQDTVIPAGRTLLEKVPALEITTPHEIEDILAGYDPPDDFPEVAVTAAEMHPYVYGDQRPGTYVTGPGPSKDDVMGFLPLSLAVSFFFMWSISGSGQPSNMVRLMAFKSTQTLRRAIFTVAIYYSCIYLPLVFIFCCARVLMPGMESESDRIMPAMAVFLTEGVGVGWLAGLLMAAPFAAVMSTVDSFLLMISSALVRDIYQRNINPDISEKGIKRLSYLCTFFVGTIAMLGALNPPDFLQDIIVYVGSGLAAGFLGPMVFALYWPRATLPGCMSGMIAGFLAHLAMYVGGIFVNESFFRPYRLLNFDPIIVGLAVSFLTTYVVSRATPPPPEHLVRQYFYKRSQ